jgi:hypothetical protein
MNLPFLGWRVAQPVEQILPLLQKILPKALQNFGVHRVFLREIKKGGNRFCFFIVRCDC